MAPDDSPLSDVCAQPEQPQQPEQPEQPEQPDEPAQQPEDPAEQTPQQIQTHTTDSTHKIDSTTDSTTDTNTTDTNTTDTNTTDTTHTDTTHTTDNRVVSFRTVNPSSLEFSGLAKDHTVYASTITVRGRDVVVQTNVVTLDLDLDADNYATLHVTGALAKFFRDIESALLQAAMDNKSAWFKHLTDDALRASFKSFVTDSTVRVRVAEDFAVFDAHKDPMDAEDLGPRAKVKAVVGLSKLRFGRTQFGGVWRLMQAQVAQSPQCLISETPEDIHDFL